MPLAPGLRVANSPIHGYGLVTTRAFRRGEFLIQGDGVLYRDHEEFDDTYALVMSCDEVDDAGKEGPSLFWDLVDQTRWINHSCAPNSEVDCQWDAENEVIHASWYALRDIEAGEELCYDYAFAADVAEPCACGVETCRGLIIDPDELDRAPAGVRHMLSRRLAVIAPEPALLGAIRIAATASQSETGRHDQNS